MAASARGLFRATGKTSKPVNVLVGDDLGGGFERKEFLEREKDEFYASPPEPVQDETYVEVGIALLGPAPDAFGLAPGGVPTECKDIVVEFASPPLSLSISIRHICCARAKQQKDQKDKPVHHGFRFIFESSVTI